MQGLTPPRLRLGLVAGASAVILGLLLVGTGHGDVGGVTLLLAWATLAAAVHSLGRLGES